MASFSFGAGNLGKLLRIPLYAAGRVATFLIPRSRDEWVFASAIGIAGGAEALWSVADADGCRTVWLTSNEGQAQDAAARGIRSVPARSLRGFWRTARARIVVVTHGLGDANPYGQHGAFVVQLWHGIPLKRIGLDSCETTRAPAALRRIPGVSRLLAVMYRRAMQRISLIPAASHFERGRLESAFGVPHDHVVVTGAPRTDALSRGTAEERRDAARTALAELIGPVAPSTRLVLYAPTWRDGDPDPAVPSATEWTAIVDTLQRNDAVLLVRSHPLGAGDYTPPFATDRVRAIGSDLIADVTPLLAGMDVLLTDYSSILFDAALVPLPLLFLAPDADAYGRRRGFYGRYDAVAGTDVARDWTAAVSQVDAVLSDPAVHAERVDRARALDERVHGFHDGCNATRVYRAILDVAHLADPTEGTP